MQHLHTITRAVINKLRDTRHTAPTPATEPHTTARSNGYNEGLTAPASQGQVRPARPHDLSGCECQHPPF